MQPLYGSHYIYWLPIPLFSDAMRCKIIALFVTSAANLVADFAVELSTAMSIGGRLSNHSSAGVGVVLSAPVMQRAASRCIRSNDFLYTILPLAVDHTKAP